jgi:unsaturated rhamnogalacturonyl hydrolase
MSHPLRAVFLVLLIIVLSQPGAIAQASDVLPSRNEIIATCILANDNWIANNGGETNPGETSQWDPGAYYTGNQRLIEILSDGIPSEATKKAVYLNRAELWAVKHFWQKDPTKDARHADSHCCGQIYIDLYRLDNQAVRLTGVNGTTGIKQTMDNVVDLGATTDGDWDWIDAFYMASPVLAKLDVTIGETDGRDYSAKLLAMYDNMRVTQNLYDGDEGLWYRDDRYPSLSVSGK